MAEQFKVGDLVITDPPPPVGEVLHVYFNGQLQVKWPSGVVSVVTNLANVQKVGEE